MLFLIGIKQLENNEKIALLSQINSLTALNLLWNETRKTTKSFQDTAAGWIQKSLKYVSSDTAKSVEDLFGKIEWEPDSLSKKIKSEQERVRSLSSDELNQELNSKLNDVACLKGDFDETSTACAIIHEAAKSLNIDARIYPDAVSLEAVVFEGAIKEIVEALKKKMENFDATERAKFEDLLKDEIDRLSKADKDAVKEALGVDDLSSHSLYQFFKTASSAAIAQVIAGSFGFGAFLFLTTIIKAFSLLLGITFPFAIYSSATSLLAFTLSFPFLLGFLLLAGGWVIKKTDHKLNIHIAKLLVITGRCKLMTK